MPSYLRAHLPLQMPFRLLSILSALMLLSLAASAPIRAIAKANTAKVGFTLMTLVAFLNPVFT